MHDCSPPLRHALGWTLVASVCVVAATATAADVRVGDLAENGWFSDDTRADGAGTIAQGTNLISTTLTDAPENAGGIPAHDAEIERQIMFGIASGPVPFGTHEGSVRLTIAPGAGGGKSQISHRKDDGIGFATGDALLDPGFFVRYSWRGDGTVSITPSFKIGFKTSEFGATASSSRTGENAWDKVLIYEPGNLNGGVADGTWRTEDVDYDTGRWWFFDRTNLAGSIGTPLTLADMATSNVSVGGRPISAVYALLTDPSAIITSVQFGIGSGNAGGDVQVNQLETSFYRPGDVVEFGNTPAIALVTADDCISTGEQLEVAIDLVEPDEIVTGGQFFLQYDPTKLDFVSLAPGTDAPFDFLIFQSVDEIAGTITLATGDPNQIFGLFGDANMGSLVFDVIGEYCATADLVTLVENASGPSTYVTGIGGTPIDTLLRDLPAVASDATAPTVIVDLSASSSLVVLDEDDAALASVSAPATTVADAFIGDGAWQGNGTAKSQYYTAPSQPLGRLFTVDEIESFQWHTKDGSAADPDWYVTIYTFADGVNDDASWYGRRITFENLYAYNRNETVGAWNEWSTAGDPLSDQVVTGIDTNNSGAIGFFGAPTLADLQAGPITWSTYGFGGNATPIDYGPEVVRFMTIETGNPWAVGFTGLVDALTITLTTGETVTYDLEQDGLAPSLDGSCEATIGFSATVLDACSVDPSSVVVTVAPAEASIDGFTVTPAGPNAVIVTGTATLSNPSACITTVTVTVEAADDCGNVGSGGDSTDVADTTAPVIDVPCPGDIVVSADAGGCDAVVSWTEPTATDNCGTVNVASTAMPGDTFGPGTTTVTYTFDDGCGNVTECSFDVTVLSTTPLELSVDLAGGFAMTSFTRCLTLEFCGVDSVTVNAVVTFTDGSFTGTVDVPCGDYDEVTITDGLHSLSQTVPVVVSGTAYEAFATGADALVLGNLNGDGFIDILDFGVYVGQLGTDYGTADTDCSTPAPHADMNGDGVVSTGDFTFIQTNFLVFGDLACSAAPLPAIAGERRFRRGGRDLGLRADGPVLRANVRELVLDGRGDLSAGDLNRDGWLDMKDVQLFLAR